MSWIIDRDYIDSGAEVGRRQGSLAVGARAFRFRLRDDDDEVYYGGRFDLAAARDDEEEGGLYQALRWGAHNAGCTDLQVHTVDAVELGITTAHYCQTVGIDPGSQAWVSIYG